MQQCIHHVFLSKLLKQNALELQSLDHRELPCLNTIVYMQLMFLMETAIKFMNGDLREKLQQDDIIAACQENNHCQYLCEVSQSFSDQFEESENVCQIIKSSEFIGREMDGLMNRQVEDLPVSGRWLVINNRVPNIVQNGQIVSFKQLKHKKQEQKERKQFLMTIIKDEPKALLTRQELIYYEKVTSMIGKDSNPKERFLIQGDSSSLIPFFLKYCLQRGINQTGINFLLSLLQTNTVWKGIQYYLSKVMNLLLAYSGAKAFDVGMKIAQLVARFQIKYPKLRDIYVTTHLQMNYSNILKKIPFAFHYDLTFDLGESFLRIMSEECEQKVEIAVICSDALATYSNLLSLNIPETHHLNGYQFWHANKAIRLKDAYLMMIL